MITAALRSTKWLKHIGHDFPSIAGAITLFTNLPRLIRDDDDDNDDDDDVRGDDASIVRSRLTVGRSVAVVRPTTEELKLERRFEYGPKAQPFVLGRFHLGYVVDQKAFFYEPNCFLQSQFISHVSMTCLIL